MTERLVPALGSGGRVFVIDGHKRLDVINPHGGKTLREYLERFGCEMSISYTRGCHGTPTGYIGIGPKEKVQCLTE